MEVLINSYMTTNEEEIEKKEFNLLLSFINKDISNLFQIIILLENYLTNLNEKKRNRSTYLLALLIENMTPITSTIITTSSSLASSSSSTTTTTSSSNSNEFNSSQLHHFIVFFNSRLNDYPSIIPSLIGIKAIINKYGNIIEKKYHDYNDIFKAIFRELEVHSLPQSMRQRIYEVIEALLLHFKSMNNFTESTDFYNSSTLITLKSSNNSLKNQLSCEEIIEGILTCIKGEKDPRCLLQCFQIITYVSEVFYSTILESKLSEETSNSTSSSSSPTKKLQQTQTQVLLTCLPEKIFEILACYYPITFHPPANDPYNITHDLLVNTLMNAMISHSSYIPYIIPLLMDHIREPSEEESLYHSFKYLLNLSIKYNLPDSISIILPDICPIIYNLISTSTRANSLSNNKNQEKENNNNNNNGHKNNKEISLNDAAVIEAESFLQYLFRTYSENSLLINSSESNNELKKFTEHIITQILNEINNMITKHEMILQSPLMPLNIRSIQSSIRSIYIARLIGNSCENGIDLIQNSLLPLLTSHISSNLSSLLNQSILTSTNIQENYVIQLLNLFNLIVSCTSHSFKISTYQTELEEFSYTIIQYFTHKCQYTQQYESYQNLYTNSNINDLKLKIELYGKLLSTFSEIIIRIPSNNYFQRLQSEILESIIRLITSNTLILDTSPVVLSSNIRSSSLLFLSTLLNYEPSNTLLLHQPLNNGCIQYLIITIKNLNDTDTQSLQKIFAVVANLVSSSSILNGLTLLQSELSSSLMYYALSSDQVGNPKKSCFALEAISILLSKEQSQLNQDSFIQFLIQSKENNSKSPLISIISEVLSPTSKFLAFNEEEWILNLLCTIIERIFSIKTTLTTSLLSEILLICGETLLIYSDDNNSNNYTKSLSSVVSILYSTFLNCESILNHADNNTNNTTNQNIQLIDKTWEVILLSLSKTSLNSSIDSITSIKAGWIISIIIYKNLIPHIEDLLSSILFDTLHQYQTNPILSSHLLLWTCRALLLSQNELNFPSSQLNLLKNSINLYLNEVLDSKIQLTWSSLESKLTINHSILWLDIYLIVISTLLLPQKNKSQELNQFTISLMLDILYSNQPMSYLNSLFSISIHISLTPPHWSYKNENKLKLFQKLFSSTIIENSIVDTNNKNVEKQESYFLSINVIPQTLSTLSQSSQVLLLLTVLGFSTEFLSYYPHEIQFYQDFFRFCLHGLMLNSSSNTLSQVISSSSILSLSSTTLIDLIYFELRLRSLSCIYQLISLTSHSPSEITVLLSPHLSSIVPILLQITQNEHSSYIGSALIRSISLQCLEVIIQKDQNSSTLLLPYSLLHPLQSQVVNKLGIVLDDNKRAIRILAANVRNKWIALKR